MAKYRTRSSQIHVTHIILLKGYGIDSVKWIVRSCLKLDKLIFRTE